MARFLLLGLILALFFSAAKLFPSLGSREGLGVSYGENISLPTSQNQPAPEISARHVFVLDKLSKTVLFQKAADSEVFPASTTKMMTALVALDKFSLDQIITVSRSYPEGQTIGLQPGEQLSIEQLLYAMLVQSGNDAAEVLAENYPGGRSAFISAMNQKAVDLNLDHTHFANPTGLDEV
ncbi:MAG: serine hydrolase, partial [Patescibacteria group bacterium]